MMKLTELQAKEVIDLQTGQRMGTIRDFDLEPRSGKIQSIIISDAGFLPVFSKKADITVAWSAIRKIGTDLIFVIQS